MRSISSKFIAVLALASIAVMAVFGLMLMDMSMTSHDDCVASRTMGEPCPLSLADAVFHHASLLRIFSTAAPSIFLAIFGLLAVSILYVLNVKLCLPAAAFVYEGRPQSDPPRFAFLRWLSIFEHSPSN